MKKALIVLMAIIISIMSVIVTIQAFNEYHINHCGIEKCNKCLCISYAMSFIKSINFVKFVSILSIIKICITKIDLTQAGKTVDTLIERKVQFNE